MSSCASLGGPVPLPPPGPSTALTPGAPARALHVELPSQQRRLRHLRNIAARNIVNRNGHQLLDTYFTLHLCDNEKIHREFYRSEVIKNSLNPTWRSLDLGIMPDRLDTSVSCFVVKIWGGKEDAYQLLIEWKVYLDGLKYLGQQIHAHNQNEVIFGLNDGYYGAPFEHKGHSHAQKTILQVDQNCVRNSYDVFSLLRLHRAQCAIKQTQVTVQRIGKEIEEKLRLTSTSNELKKESECLRLKILVLRNELERQQKALGREVALLHKQQVALQDKGSAFSTEHGKLQLQKESLSELRKECTAKRELFLKTNAQLTIRCRQLLSELSYIYPIDLNEHKDYFVCGVKLPNSEDFQAKDDGSIAVALGYTAHLVSMISFFLQVPLRYPIIHKGSRSTIKDNINDKLTEKERELHRAQCAIKQTQVTVQRIGKEIEEKLRLTSTSNELKKESECLRLKILVLRNELERQKKALGREVAFLHKQQMALQDKGSAFSTERGKLQLQKESLSELRKECTAKRELFLKTNAQLTIRCRQLLSELSYIYPIDLNEHKDYFVCGVKLPNSEDFQAKDDGSIAVALGYTAHLVSMISFFLQVPLRYPIIHKGSRSTIKDNINDKLTEKEREFPLYPKGGEKLQFDYGVYLLNKNIAQLRYQHGLGTPDLRQTLPNLKNFMEHGLMVRCDRHHISNAIPVPKRQSSIFGGADVGFSTGIPSPDKVLRKRASSENERLQYKTPPPSYNSALAQPGVAMPTSGDSERKVTLLSSSLDTSLGFSKENKKAGVDVGNSVSGDHGNADSGQEQGETLPAHLAAINGTALPSEQAGPAGTLLPAPCHPAPSAELCCAVEQAEEIIGLEATGFTSGDQLEALSCIPVDSAVAVECDEQVLGEFEEFSRRIYALSENVSSFRRPRRSSDK